METSDPSSVVGVGVETEAIPQDEALDAKKPINDDDVGEGDIYDSTNAEDQPLTTPTSPIKDSQRLITDQAALNWSLYSVRLAVFADMVTSTILDPNYAFMAFPGAHKDSFDSTKPFGFNAATYFLAMTALLGAAISSTVIGTISDRVGRKPCIQVCLCMGSVGAIVAYLARRTFWGFCAANFAQGLFAGSLPVAMAYASDVSTNQKAKDEEIGILVGAAMLGTSGGGVAAILMEDQGLFTPLFLGAAFNILAASFAYFYMIEPSKMLFVGTDSRFAANDDDDDDDDQDRAPTTVDQALLINIVSGALFDNVGSAGLLPIAMSPLAFNTFYASFVENGEEPIMTQSAFKWISVMVALTVIPGAAFSTFVFDKIGAAGGCVAGNVVTGIVIIICMEVAFVSPPSTGTFAGFIIALYIGFPFTVLSQLSTGPMLDMIAPSDRRGFVQGINITVMNFATAVSPYLLGEMADNVGIRQTMWTCIAISFGAALVNLPLVFVSKLRRPPPKLPKYLRALKGEDVDFIELAMQGKWVPAKQLDTLNEQRMVKGEPWLVIPYRPYEEDKQYLAVMRKEAKADFQHLRGRVLEYLNDPKWDDIEHRRELANQFKNSRAPKEQREKLAEGLSNWFADYLIDSGYYIEDSPIMYKQMIMTAFPPINSGKELNEDTIESLAVNYLRVLNKYLDDKDLSGAQKAFAHAL